MKTWAVRARKKANRLFVLWTIRLVLLLSRALPYRVGVACGSFLGLVGYFILPRERSRATGNLALAFPGKDAAWIRRTARRCFVHLGKSMLEAALITPKRLPRVARFEGVDNLERALAQGKGVLYVTGHVGNWELSGGVIGSRCALSVIAAPLEPEALNDLVVDLRNRNNMRIIVRGRPGATRELIRVFKENRVLGLLIDQDTDVDGAFVQFMGRPCWTPTAAASMALKFGAPVVFGYAQRHEDNRHTVTLEGPLELIRTGDDEKDIIANTQMFTKKIEDCIMKNPEQWVWMHRRWRRQP